jgi:putative aldouronate transport system substrate-binding protein
MDVFAMVKERYPDMAPMTFSSSHRFNVMLCWIGLGIAPFVEQADGSYVYYIRDERYKELMRILNRMYQKGYLLAENFAAEPSQLSSPVTSLYNSGKAFSVSTCTQTSNVNAQAKLARINPSYLSVELEPFEGSSFTTADLGWSGTFITTTNSNPGMSIELMRWMFTPEAQKLTQWGREGMEYNLNAQGLPEFTAGVLDSIADDTYTKTYNPWFYLGGSAIHEAEGRCMLLPWDLYEKPYTAIRKSYRNQEWVAAALPMGDEAENEIYKRISNSVSSYESKVVLSATDDDFETAFSEYMNDMVLMDVERLERYMTEEIAVVKKRYDAIAGM